MLALIASLCRQHVHLASLQEAAPEPPERLAEATAGDRNKGLEVLEV